MSNEGTIALLALGRKNSGEPLHSEDTALLSAVAGQIATALENARLYRQLHLKATELDRLRAFNENILESLDDGLLVLDLGDRIVWWNKALEQLYGVPRVSAVGRLLRDVFDAPVVEAICAARRDTPEGAVLSRIPLTRRGEVGQSIDHRQRGRGSAPRGRRRGGHRGREHRDPRGHHAARRARGAAADFGKDGLDRSAGGRRRARGEHAADRHLELHADAARGRRPARIRSTRLLEKIERQTFRAAKIVNGLLNLSRPASAGGDGCLSGRSQRRDQRRVSSLLEHQFELQHIKVRRELSSDPVTVLGLEHKLQQVFLNLFLNAKDAMPKGGWLSVITSIKDGKPAVELADTGSGIPSEYLARIYDPFFTTKSIGHGTGLGLSITYGIVREHHGSIDCESVVGQGTRFVLEFPPVPFERPARAAQSLAERHAPQRLHPGRRRRRDHARDPRRAARRARGITCAWRRRRPRGSSSRSRCRSMP